MALKHVVFLSSLMIRFPFLLIFLALATTLPAQRKKLEQAATYERAGMLKEAFDRYELLYKGKARNVAAHVGMGRCAQGILDRMQLEASGSFLLNDLALGERQYAQALAYKQEMDRKGLELQWDQMMAIRRREAQRHEAERLYQEAETAFRSDRFAEAEELSKASLALDGDRKEVEYLVKISRLEPIYRQGLRAMELGLWRDAYKAFVRVNARDTGYKESWELQAQAEERARVIIAYIPLFNAGLYSNGFGIIGDGQLENRLAASVKQSLLDLKDPLLVLIDRDNTDELLAEQQRQLSGIYDDRYVVEAGKLMGARYVLTARLLRYDEILRREVEVQVQLLDGENGRIHLSEIVRVNKQEITRGNTRSQLLERAAKRIAQRLADFDPFAR